MVFKTNIDRYNIDQHNIDNSIIDRINVEHVLSYCKSENYEEMRIICIMQLIELSNKYDTLNSIIKDVKNEPELMSSLLTYCQYNREYGIYKDIPKEIPYTWIAYCIYDMKDFIERVEDFIENKN